MTPVTWITYSKLLHGEELGSKKKKEFLGHLNGFKVYLQSYHLVADRKT